MLTSTQSCLLVTILIFIHTVIPHYSETFFNDLYSTLYTNEKTILRILHQPKLEDGPTLLSALDKYNEKLVHLVSIIREDNATFDPARKICDGGGPAFLKIELDNENLKKSLNWTEESLEEMYYLKGATELLWWELRQLDDHGETYSIIRNNTKDEISFLHDLDKDNRLNELLEFTKINDFERTDKPHKQLQS